MNKRAKKEFFSLGVYVEGLRQLRIPGIVFAVLMGLGGILVPVGLVFLEFSQREMNGVSATINAVAVSVTGAAVNPLLILSFLLVAPLMTLILFHFLNKRNASDFYHSTPHTRIAVYVSLMAAIFTWLAILILFSGLVSIVTVLFCGKYMTLLYGSLFLLMLGCFIASVFVSGVVSFSMMITGTIFSNVIVSGLVLFLPRFCVLVLSSSITGTIPFLTEGLPPLLSGRYNLVTEFILRCLGAYGNSSPLDCLTAASGMIYTVVIAVVFVVAAAILFYLRKSESAGQAALNRTWQAVFRIAVTMVVCIAICCGIFSDLNRIYANDEILGSQIFLYVTCYLVAILVYFLYELISTRKWKNVVRAIPAFSIVIALNIAIFLGLYGIRASEMAFIPKASEIQSVSVVPMDNMTSSYSITFLEYAEQTGGSSEITDPKILEAVSESLKENVDAYQQKNGVYFDRYYSDKAGTKTKYIQYQLSIESTKGTKTRKIFVPSELSEQITQARQKSPDYIKAWTTLPQPLSDISVNNLWLSGQDVQSLYDTFCEEFSKVDFQAWNERNLNSDISLFNFRYQIHSGSSDPFLVIPVYRDLFPQTCNQYFQYNYTSFESEIDSVLQKIASADAEKSDFYYTMTLNIKDEEHGQMQLFMEELSADNEKALRSAIRKQPVTDQDDGYIQIYISDYSSGREGAEYELLLPVDMAQLDLSTFSESLSGQYA